MGEIMKQTVFAITFVLVTLSMVVFAQDTRNESVRFAPGTSSEIIKETINGYQSVNYKLGAKAG